MKSTKQSRNFAARALSIAICIALIFCAVFSFGFINTKDRAFADEGNPVKDENGIRFVQVAAGEDFAIGLTYDNKLYGWNLKGGAGGSTSGTLGDYYPAEPMEINVIFRNGPGTRDFTWSSSAYHDEKVDTSNNVVKDQILSIAATRTTAAFITTDGYIYTWGNDDVKAYENVEFEETGATPHYLLLRDDQYGTHYEPYIINYNYYANETSTTNFALQYIKPSGLTKNSFSLAAGEYNYIFGFVKDSNYNTYVWGSMMYAVPNVEPLQGKAYNYVPGSDDNDLQGGANKRYIYRAASVTTSTSSYTVVAGGYNVGINVSSAQAGGTSLQVRGKNVILSQGGTSGYNYTYEVLKSNDTTVDSGNAVSPISYNSITVDKGIVGGNGAKNNVDQYDAGANNGQYYGIQAQKNSSSDALVYAITNTVAYIKNANGQELKEATMANAVNYAVSLGNDIGYGISDGYLYAWGDNANGQLGNSVSDKYSSTPTSPILSNIKSVAAGKQLSGSARAFYSNATFVTSEDPDINGTFNSAVQNKEQFITGALNTSGELYVWSNFDSTPTKIIYGNAKGTPDNFLAVYSGYGNNIFAVTELGKLVRITYDEAAGKYVQVDYDAFRDTSGKLIENWAVNSGVNKVSFTVPATDEKTPDLGTVTLYVWETGKDITDNVRINGTSQEYSALVKSNVIGDAYRLLSADDNGIEFLSMTASNPSFAPTFKIGNTELTPQQRANMFEFEMVVDDANGRGIKITPLQSSNGRDITVTLYVARFNRAADFTVSGTTVTDNAIYYDYKELTFTFTIDDTKSIVEYATYADAGNGEEDKEKGNSYIPLLDPNNDYNNRYSLAVQDISSGIGKLADYFKLSSSDGNTFKQDIIEQMTANDKGFPSSQKVTDGNLEYYLGAGANGASLYYNDSYRYLFSDRDADRVVINSNNGVILSAVGGASSTAVSGAKQKVDITVDLSAYNANGELDDLIAAFTTDFNNKYGIYNVSFNDNKLAFSYDVITFTATNSTGSVSYDGNDISSPLTTSSNPRVTATLNAATVTDGSNAAAGTAAINGNTTGLIALFSQASLRINSGVLPDKDNKKNPVIIGENDGINNYYTVTYPTRIYVGDTVTLKLEDYVNNLGTSIYFSYNDKTDFTGYNGQFTDETNSGVKVVNLESRSLTVSPTTNAPINLEVVIQRFANNQAFAKNSDSGDGNEKIYITFIFNDIVSFEFKANSEITTKFTITKPETINLFGGNINGDDYKAYAVISGVPQTNIDSLTSKVRISEPIQTGSDYFTAARPSATGTSITVTPKSSGSGLVQFTATVYGQSLLFTIEINVSYVTVLGDSDNITLVNEERVYINELLSKLKSANSFNNNIDEYTVLYTDVRDTKDSAGNDIMNAIYFTNEMYDTIDAEVGYPTFIKSVVYEGAKTDKPYIKIVPSATASEDSKTYYMHVRFITGNSETYAGAPDGSILEVVFEIKSGKTVVTLNGDDQVKVNVKQNRSKNSGIWYTEGTGLNMIVHISAKDLLDYIGREDSTSYTIFYVAVADDDAAKCFTYDFDAGDNEILITPLYNTDGKSYAVDVSVYNQNQSTSLVMSFDISIDGIVTTLPVMTDDSGLIGYGEIWLYSFIIVLSVLVIIFVIRIIVYWRRRAKQRAIVKRNQELIRMRDRMHNKANIASKEQIVRTKMKMEDPKYAKLFNEMRKDAEASSGITLDNSDLAATAKAKSSKKKKKGGKKSVAELKAELEAKKAAFAAAQAQSVQPVNPFANDVPMDGGGFGAPANDFGAPMDSFAAQPVDEKEIVFDASDIGDGM